MNENQVTISDPTKNVRVVAFVGSIDTPSSAKLEAILLAQIQNGHPHLILDMSGVDHISSRGLRMLVGAWKRAHDMKGDILIAALRPQLREVMSLIGFDLVFGIFDSVADAAAKIQA